jgi:hypothetical protein
VALSYSGKCRFLFTFHLTTFNVPPPPPPLLLIRLRRRLLILLLLLLLLLLLYLTNSHMYAFKSFLCRKFPTTAQPPKLTLASLQNPVSPAAGNKSKLCLPNLNIHLTFERDSLALLIIFSSSQTYRTCNSRYTLEILYLTNFLSESCNLTSVIIRTCIRDNTILHANVFIYTANVSPLSIDGNVIASVKGVFLRKLFIIYFFIILKNLYIIQTFVIRYKVLINAY